MSDHCVHSRRTYYLLHFNFRAASRTVTLRWGPQISAGEKIARVAYLFDLIPRWKNVTSKKVRFLAKVLTYAIVYKNDKLQSVLEYVMAKSFFVWKAHLKASLILKDWQSFASLFRHLENEDSTKVEFMSRYVFFLFMHTDEESAEGILKTLERSVNLPLLFSHPSEFGLTINHIGQARVQAFITMINTSFQASDEGRREAKEFWSKRACDIQVIKDGQGPLRRNWGKASRSKRQNVSSDSDSD